MDRSSAVPLMNNTKWDEIRLAMHAIHPTPGYRTRCIENGFISDWDHDWFYHFRIGGYGCIEWLEIACLSQEQLSKVVAALKTVHVPGTTTERGVVVYGYAPTGTPVEYL